MMIRTENSGNGYACHAPRRASVPARLESRAGRTTYEDLPSMVSDYPTDRHNGTSSISRMQIRSLVMLWFWHVVLKLGRCRRFVGWGLRLDLSWGCAGIVNGYDIVRDAV